MSNYTSKKTTRKITTSDHYPVILTLDLSIPVVNVERTGHFNFRDINGQASFFHMTDNTNLLSEAISTTGTFKNQVAKWDKQLKKIPHTGFPKNKV